jgi:hypothetical protein
MKNALIVVLVAMMFVGTAAAAEQKPKILYNGLDLVDQMIVGVDPVPISPPISVEYDGWNYNNNCGPLGNRNCSTYIITVTNEATQVQVCSKSGNITSDPFTVELPDCKIPKTSVGVNHTILAFGNSTNSRTKSTAYLGVDGSLYPTPELSPVILTSAGILGLVGISRMNRKK